MIIAGQSVGYAGDFHNDQGTLEDPTTPTARIRTPAGVWSSLTTPTKQDGKTGLFGGSIDTTGFAAGRYLINLQGNVSTGKATAKVDPFVIVDPAAFKADVSALATEANVNTVGADVLALNNFDPDVDVVASVALVDVTTLNTDQRGTDSAALASVTALEATLTEMKGSGFSASTDTLEQLRDAIDGVLAEVENIQGGLAIVQTPLSTIVTQGTATGAVSDMNTKDLSYYTVTDAGAGIDFEIRFDIGSGSAPVSVIGWGRYTEATAPKTLQIDGQVWNFDTLTWDTIHVFTDAVADAQFDVALAAAYIGTSGADDGIVILRALQSGIETGSALRLDQLNVRFIPQQATAVITLGTAQGAGNGVNQIVLAANAPATDGALDPAVVFISAGTGFGQTREILEYEGAARKATVGRSWKVQPVAGDTRYIILADKGDGSVNEGLAQGGGTNTITLNTLASGSDGYYEGQIVALVSGAGEDQAAVVISYDGDTKIAILDRNWIDVPGVTTGYKMYQRFGVNTVSFRDAITALASKSATAPSWIGGTFSPLTDSLESVRDVVDTLTPGGGSVNPLTVTIEDQFAAPLILAQIQITDVATGTVFLGAGSTDANGEVVITGLNAGDYLLVGFLPGYSIPATTITVVTGPGTDTVTAAKLVVSPPSAPELSKLFGDLADIGGTADEGVEIIVKSTADGGWQPVFVDDIGVTSDEATTTTDTNGHFEIEVLKNVAVLIEITELKYNRTATLTEDTVNIKDI